MHKVLIVMHDHVHDDYYRMNKVDFAGYVSSKGAVALVVVHQVEKELPVNDLYGLNIEEDLDD